MLRHRVSYKHYDLTEIIQEAEIYDILILMEKRYAMIYKCKIILDNAQMECCQEFKYQ